MPEDTAKMQSHHIFHFARKHLGRSTLYAIFGRKNTRIIEYWCQDPLYTSKPDEAYDPLRGVKSLLETLDDHGHCGVVRSCIAYLLSGTSLECGINPQLVEPKATMTEEILADYKAVAALQAAIESSTYADHIVALKEAAIAEIERTFAKYCQDNRK